MRKVIMGLLGFFMLLMLGACQGQTVQGVEKEENKMKSKVTSSEHPDIQIESKIIESENYQYAVHFPKMLSDKWNDEMERWKEEKIKNFEQEVQELEIPDQQWPYELHIDFEIFDATDSFISVKFNESKFLGGAHTEETTFTYNFDREKKQFVFLADLFKHKSNYLQLLSELSYGKLMEIPEMKELVWDENFQAGIDPIEENFESFVIHDGKLIIFFQRYQVGPNSVGSPMIEFEKEELQTVLRENKKNGNREQDEERPIGKEVRLETLKKQTLNPDKKHIALTFDDGPHGTVTPKILDILADYDAQATFFVLGNRIEFHPEVLIRMKKEGHEIGNHSWSHPQLTNLSEEEVKAQINHTNIEIEKVIGETETMLIRPPYGAMNEMTKQYINQPIIHWSVDTNDWKTQNPESILEEVQNQVFDGSIIRMHDVYPSTAEGLADVLAWLNSEGYQVVTVSQLLGFDDLEAIEAGKIYTAQ